MLRTTLSAAVFFPAVLGAQEPGKKENSRLERPNLSPALDLLPEGSTLKKVRIPRYDEEKRPSALLRAELIRVVSEDNVIGKDIEVFMFAPSGRERLRMQMGTADYTVSSGILEAHQNLDLRGEGFTASGAGGVFQLDSRRGFLHGPVTNTIDVDLDEALSAMPPDPLQTLIAMTTLLVAAPEPLTPAQLQRHAEISRSNISRIEAEVAPTREMITRTDQLSQAAGLGFRAFVNEIKRPGLLALAADGAPAGNGDPKPNPGGIHITCDGGMYFDAEKGHVVYLKNIEISESRFTMSCAKELKIILEKKENTGEKKDLAGPEAFGDVQNIIATGGVRIVRKDPKGKHVVATADTATYDAKSGDFVLRGGFPSLKQGNNYIRAREPGLYIRLYEDGSAYWQPGKWETDLESIDKLQKK